MELVRNIFFNTDKLIQNSKVKISYTGKFFEENSEEVFIHYGFGANWDNLNEIKMEKTELGFQTELEKPCMDLIVSDIDYSLDRPNRLRKSYIWNKKIRLAIYKIIHYIPKLISGNYKKKALEQ